MKKKNVTNIIVGPIETNCWIYPFSEKDAIVIDPGDEADKIISVLRKLDLFPTYILLTHGHFDHIAALPELVQFYKTGKPKVAVHRLDSDYIGPNAYKTHSVSVKAAMGNTSFIDAAWTDFPPHDLLLDEGDTIGPFTVLHIPGHTQGSLAFWDKEEGNLFTGDTLFAGDYGRTDLPGGSRKDIFKSLNRLFAMDSGINVYPGHGETTTIGRESSQNSARLA